MRHEFAILGLAILLLASISIIIIIAVQQEPTDIKILRDQILECGKQHPYDLDEWKKCVDALQIH